MPRQLWITDEIVARGKALYSSNWSGPLITDLKIFDEQFVIATTNDWTEGEANGTTIAVGAVDGGAMRMTASGINDDCGELSHTAQWSAASNCGMLAKIKISAITAVDVCFGFVDAAEATNDHVAGELVTTPTLRDPTVTADFCGMVFDTDATTDVWYMAAINNNTIGTPVAATGSLAPVANTYFYGAIQTDTAGNVLFYYGTKLNELKPVGVLKSAIAYASTNLLTPYVGFIARDTNAQVCTVSRIITWQDN